jgi:rhamnulokinase
VPLFDPDHPSLLHGGDVPARVASLCAGAGQAPPAQPGEIVRAILTSLACKYRLVLEQLQVVTGRRVQIVHVVGGGTRNELLCQLTAVGELDSLGQMRELVGAATPMTRYEPSAGQPNDETYDRFLAVTGLGSQRPAHVEV